jgi:hypothetical protein
MAPDIKARPLIPNVPVAVTLFLNYPTLQPDDDGFIRPPADLGGHDHSV